MKTSVITSSTEDENLNRQLEEISALKAIFNNIEFNTANNTGSLLVSVNLPSKRIKVHASCSTNQIAQTISVAILSPIQIIFYFPENYPSNSPPEISLHCNWLSAEHLRLISNELTSRFEPDNEILFNWISVISLETFEILKLDKNEINLEESFQDSVAILKHLAEYNQEKENQNFYPCQICLDTVVGADCMRLMCENIFCKNCLKEYFKINIREGNVENIKCPDPTCGEKIPEFNIKSVVHPQLFERFDRLLFERSLESMQDVYYCPRKNCGTPCVAYDAKECICICENCQQVFCTKCMVAAHGVYHGVPLGCSWAHTDQKDTLIDEYRQAEYLKYTPKMEFLEEKYPNIASYGHNRIKQCWVDKEALIRQFLDGSFGNYSSENVRTLSDNFFHKRNIENPEDFRHVLIYRIEMRDEKNKAAAKKMDALDEEKKLKKLLKIRFFRQQLRKNRELTARQAMALFAGTRCPGCGITYQKSDGCNQMTCPRCNTHFTYVSDNIMRSRGVKIDQSTMQIPAHLLNGYG
jgi:E3 ubiquitin-protein ligase RNF14